MNKEPTNVPKSINEKDGKININLNVCVNCVNINNENPYIKRHSIPDPFRQKNKNKSKNAPSNFLKFNPDDYTVINQIGQGTFGKIFKVKSNMPFLLLYAGRQSCFANIRNFFDIDKDSPVFLPCRLTFSPVLLICVSALCNFGTLNHRQPFRSFVLYNIKTEIFA